MIEIAERRLQVTNLDLDQAQRAAKVAASKFFSTDPAIGKEDLEQYALLRILDRDPTTMGAAVHVGREGIAREIGYQKYRNASTTTNLSILNSQDDGDRSVTLNLKKPPRGSSTVADAKVLAYVKKMIKRHGRPVETFGRFGICYNESEAPKLLVDRFKSGVPVGDRETILIREVRITEQLRRLADQDYVLCLLVGRD